jgi:cytochrome P450
VHPPLHFDPFAYATHEDPYPIYKRLREEAPVYRNDDIGFWALSRHADVLAAFKDPVRFSNAKGVALEQGGVSDPTSVTSFLAMDPPRHDKLRGLVSRGFTPRRVAELEPHIRDLARHYLDTFAERGRCDFIQELAGKLPMDVVSEMLGVPAADRDMLRHWADSVLHRDEGAPGIPKEAIDSSMKLLGYFGDLLRERKRSRGADLVSDLIVAEVDGERLSDADIMGFLFLMIIAGNETTTKLLGNALYWSWKNPGERAKVRRNPALIPQWVEETLRYDNSTQALMRTMTRAHEIRGETLAEGDRVLLLIGSANRDEEVFERADVYDIERDTSASLSFGRGTHFCLGASLARLEGRVSLEEVMKAIPDYELDEGGLVRVHSTNVRGFANVPIEFTPRA